METKVSNTAARGSGVQGRKKMRRGTRTITKVREQMRRKRKRRGGRRMRVATGVNAMGVNEDSNAGAISTHYSTTNLLSWQLLRRWLLALARTQAPQDHN